MVKRECMSRILLIAPVPLRFELTQDKSLVSIFGVKGFMAPLQIATIAGLTPAEHEVMLWDEAVLGQVDLQVRAKDYDLVGITGFTAHLPRAKAIADFFRSQGVLTVIGGSGISSVPDRFRNDFDVFFIGEAELTWPQFLEDWKNGRHRRIYRQISPVDLSISPVPRWNNLAAHMSSYHLGGVQTSRGCPFDCEFCDVGYLFGHRFRHKPIQSVLAEIRQLEELGMRRVVFCDDNFIGNPNYTKELLDHLTVLNNSFASPLGFAGEVSINIANDDVLLERMADVNFIEVFVGIESPNKESLKASNKLQNFRSNLVSDIKKIQSYGMSVRGSLIVGFDHDDKDIFDQQFNFVQEAGLTIPSIRVLMAPPGTRLWKRLRSEKRLLKTESEGRFFGNPGTTNILPRNLTRTELHAGYLRLIAKVYAWENFAQRYKNFIMNIKRKPHVPKQKTEWKRIIRFIRFLFGVDSATRRCIIDLLRFTWKHAPFMMPRVIGIIIRQYGYAARPQLKEAVQKQVDNDTAGEQALEIDDTEPFVTDQFAEAYQKVFPAIFEDVSHNLLDKARIEEVLVDIFTQFIANAKSSLQTLSDAQREELVSLAAQIIRQNNEASGRLPGDIQSGRTGKIESNMKSLSSQILKAVEQNLLLSESHV